MLTGGLGYTYSLSSAPPLVQTNLPAYPWTANVPADGKAQGGLSVPAPNVWKVATGYTGRRPIVDNARCKTCHGALGVAPTFHAGQRNDGPTCSFCHNPNRTSSGWSAGVQVLHPRHPRRPEADGAVHLARRGGRPGLRRGRVPRHAERLHHLPRPEHVRLHAPRPTWRPSPGSRSPPWRPASTRPIRWSTRPTTRCRRTWWPTTSPTTAPASRSTRRPASPPRRPARPWSSRRSPGPARPATTRRSPSTT